MTLALAIVGAGGCYDGLAVNRADPPLPMSGDDDDDHGGSDDGSDSDDAPPADTPRSGTAPRIWRLTWTQYDQTLQELLDDPAVIASTAFDEDLLINAEHGFTNEARSLRLSGRVARQLASAAEALAQNVVDRRAEFLPCTPASVQDAACVADFLETFARTAWRRPPDDEERQRLVALAQVDDDAAEGLAMSVEAILLSPNFLFRFEIGQAQGESTVLTDHEIASAISYTLWNRPPDAELDGLAESGALQDPATREAQARRMIADPRAHSALFTFVPDWLGLVPAARLEKDPVRFPQFSPEAAEEIEQGMRSFLASVMADDGRLETLLTASHAFAGPASSWIYGDHATPTGEFGDNGLQRLALDPDARAGLLSQAAFLASHANAVESSFVHRGLVIRERLGCETPAAPPDDATPLPQPKDGLPTARQRFEHATSPPQCNGCHTSFTPLGYAFESYDAVGAYRSHENGAPLDTTGFAPGFELEDPAFADGIELTAMLATSPVVAECVTDQMFRYIYGRAAAESDDDALAAAYAHFAAHDHDLRELIIALVTDERFVVRFVEPQD